MVPWVGLRYVFMVFPDLDVQADLSLHCVHAQFDGFAMLWLKYNHALQKNMMQIFSKQIIT